jgi:Zn-dependent M28 family amino/carboxypeptidase
MAASLRWVLFVLLTCYLPTGCQAQTIITSDHSEWLYHIEFLSADSLEGRRTGTPGNAKARAYIRNLFESYTKPVGSSYDHPFVIGNNEQAEQGINIIGYIPGTLDASEYIVLSAHYDHLGVRNNQIYNGADDNASGVAALLAALAYFAEHPPEHSILFLAFDAEELGLQGAQAFVANPPVSLESVRLNVNLDMVSRNENRIIYVAGTTHYPFLRTYIEGLDTNKNVTLKFGHDSGSGGDNWTFSSDHGPFHRAGIPFLYFGVEDHQDYHQPTDDYKNIDADFFRDVVGLLLETVTILDKNLPAIVEQAVH